MSLFGLRWLHHGGREVGVVCQGENGPCPLLSVANVLLLRGSVSLPAGAADFITGEQLLALLRERLLSTAVASGDGREALHEALALLPGMERGLDVDPRFGRCEGFQFTPSLSVFDAAGVRLLHGWVVGPQEPEAALLSAASYDVLMLRSAASAGDGAGGAAAAPQPGAALIAAWLRDTASQLTPAGLAQMRACLREGELAAFYRNGHFSTLTRAGEHLYTLITDVGYQEARHAVWERLSASDTELCDASFATAAERDARALGGIGGDGIGGGGGDEDFALALQLQREEEGEAASAAAAAMAAAAAAAHGPPAPGASSASMAPPQPQPRAPARITGRHDRYASQAAALRAVAQEREERGKKPGRPVLVASTGGQRGGPSGGQGGAGGKDAGEGACAIM